MAIHKLFHLYRNGYMEARVRLFTYAFPAFFICGSFFENLLTHLKQNNDACKR